MVPNTNLFQDLVRRAPGTIAGGEVVSADRNERALDPLTRAAAARPTEELTKMRGPPTRPLRAAAVALGLAGLFAPAARAHHYRLESATLPTPFVQNGRVDVVIEPSGVAPLGDGRRVLVASDNAAPLHVVDLATGALVGAPLGSPKFPPTTNSGPNWGGMALDSEGNYYLIGSHSGKSDEERASRSTVVRFRLQGSEQPAIDDASVVHWDIARSLEAALRVEGLDAARVAKRRVEGLAIREGGGRRELVIGLSEPDDKVRAFVANITAAPAPDAELKVRPLFAFDAGSREGCAAQLTSLEYVPVMGGFLVLTATVDADNVFHGNTLWLVANGERRLAKDYATFEVAMKATGLAVLRVETAGGETAIKLLFTYDNDPHATKIPSRFQTATLVHPRR
jgi:hypothetical protein